MSPICDSYLLDVPFQRAAVVAFGQGEQNLVSFIARQGGRMKLDDDGGLGRIGSPSWLVHKDYKNLIG